MKNATSTAMPGNPVVSTARIRVWDLPVRLFHWSLVAAIALAFLSSEEDSALSDWHTPAGWAAATLIAFRLVWGFVGGEHARFARFVKPSKIGDHLRNLSRGRPEPSAGHNPLGALAVLGLLGLVAATVASGALLAMSGDEDLHEAVAWSLLALIALHVAAVLAMSVLTGENLPRAMVTGDKTADRHPGAADAVPPPAWAAPLAAAAAVGAAGAILLYDPDAFTPGPRDLGGQHSESGEANHEAGGGPGSEDDD